jgi:negative regulator of flagellin synthesis FlgM
MFSILDSSETTLKISSTSSNNPLNGVTSGTRSDVAAGTHSAAQAGSGKPSVDLSPVGRHLAALQDGSSDIQIQRVQKIRDAITFGQLQIDPGHIADGLLASLRDLLK